MKDKYGAPLKWRGDPATPCSIISAILLLLVFLASIFMR